MVRGWETVPRVLTGWVHFEALEGRGPNAEPVLTPKMTRYAMEQEVLGFWVDTEAMTIFLPQWKMDLVECLEVWPPGRQTATVREALLLARKLPHAACVVHRLLQLIGLHLNR